MNLMPRRLSGALMLGAALWTASQPVWATPYPDKPVKLLVPTAVGGAVDIVARIVAQALAVRWKQAVLVENKPGAGGAIGVAQVSRSANDGYTLAFISTGYTALSSINSSLSFDPAKDLVPVAMIGAVPYALLVRNDSPYKTVAELVQYAKKSPGQLSYASGGNGTLTHLLPEWFKNETGVDILHVPYRGAGPALQALLGGQVAVYFDPISTSSALVKAGKLRALATTGPVRSPLLPGVPTLTEAGIPVRGLVWFAVLAPKGVSGVIVDQLNTDINAVLADVRVHQALTSSGVGIQPMSIAGFGDYLASETAIWGGVIRRNSIQTD